MNLGERFKKDKLISMQNSKALKYLSPYYLLLFILAPLVGFAEEAFVCQSSSDCVVVQTACGGLHSQHKDAPSPAAPVGSPHLGAFGLCMNIRDVATDKAQYEAYCEAGNCELRK